MLFKGHWGWTLAALLISGIGLSTGCGKFKTAAVSGVITLNDKPLGDATVTFTPVETVEGQIPISTGRTDSDGKYKLELISDQSQGALIGKNRVTVALNFESESDVMTAADLKRNYLPQHDFSFDVVAGNNEANFNLESKPGNKK